MFTFAIAVIYELYRATVKAAVIVALFLRLPGAAWAGLVFSVAIIIAHFADCEQPFHAMVSANFG